MLVAAFWGLVGGLALLLGALLGIFAPVSNRVVGLVMAFGAGVLISAVSFELTEEAFSSGGAVPVVTGLVAGALTFFAGDWAIDRAGGHRRKSPTGQPQAGAGAGALVLGALLDGIPESAAIGVSLLGGGAIGLPMVAAVFLSNVPESMSASAGLRRAGHSVRSILLMWSAVTAVCALAAGLGYVLLDGAPEEVVAVIKTFAAGAIITMLADTMVPEATEHAGRWVGLLTVLGFAAAFLLSAAA
ncbi:ZIP family metal transporter [Janibacter massiliensis]|uniref:ZIP family metal transporter n=1 Tax=Janibacter massiliensis TaxID=2058291 RepID=UPI000D108771|nr:ZIP family zinc transporter [Janibacter massiliensis]